ncbi:MAG: anti-sigma factor antagonist [Planctomycetes bacterium]|nr:anti-sigma factor antagonist [Planctomycetota bacterium]
MAELTFDIERIPSLEKAALVKVTGAIDTKTVVGFQDRLDELQKEGYLKFILDMEGIKYVNSTGLGALVNVADNLETSGGGMVLVKIHPKVKVVFDMLGLNAFFKIYKNEQEALDHFKGKGAPAQAAAPAKAWGATAPTPPPKSAPARAPASSAGPTRAATPPPAAPARAETPPPAAPAPIQAKSQPIAGDPGAFSVVCAQCNVNLTLRKPGSYKCPRCSSFFRLAKDGLVQFFKRKSAPVLKMTLACTDECREGLAEFLGVIARRIGFEDAAVRQLKTAVGETCNEIVEKAYDNQPHLTYNVMISASSTNIKIQFADYGKFIQTSGNSVFVAAKKAMDTFEHKKHPKGGNVISMSKQV